MNLLRLSAILAVSIAFVAVAAAADDKAVDKDKIVGAWEATKSGGKRLPQKIVLQFTKDGKWKATVTGETLAKGSKKKVPFTETTEGAYKIEGDKLTIVLKQKNEEEKRTITIKTLTDKKLVTVDERNNEDEFEKK